MTNAMIAVRHDKEQSTKQTTIIEYNTILVKLLNFLPVNYCITFIHTAFFFSTLNPVSFFLFDFVVDVVVKSQKRDFTLHARYQSR